MKLKKTSVVAKTAPKTVTPEVDTKGITKRLEELYKVIENAKKEIAELKERKIAAEILPFKLGECVMFEAPAGKSKKWQKCILETEDGYLYARPYKNDGELSSRHFLVTWITNSITDVLRPVEE